MIRYIKWFKGLAFILLIFFSLMTEFYMSFQLLSVLTEWGLYSSPKPHAFTSLPLQSDLFKSITGKIGTICLTSSVLIPLALNFGLSLGYRIPTRFMLDQLGLLQIYPLFSTVIVLCSILIIQNSIIYFYWNNGRY